MVFDWLYKAFKNGRPHQGLVVAMKSMVASKLYMLLPRTGVGIPQMAVSMNWGSDSEVSL